MGEESIPRWHMRCGVPSGQTMNVFFYDGPISRAIAFEDVLADGKRFSDRLLGAFSDTRTWPQLVHIATDGETYGHHKGLRRYGACVRLELHRIQQTGPADQLCGISGEASANPGSQSYRKQFVELRARGGTLEERLRLQLRRAFRTGTSNGERHYARPSTGCGIPWLLNTRSRPRNSLRIRGVLGTLTSMWCWTARART